MKIALTVLTSLIPPRLIAKLALVLLEDFAKRTKTEVDDKLVAVLREEVK